MNAFLKQLRKEIDSAFLSPNQWGKYRKVNGKEMLTVVDPYRLSELRVKSQYAEELYRAELILFVKPEDFGARPARGAIVNLDDKDYRVIEASGEMLYRIILEALE